MIGAGTIVTKDVPPYAVVVNKGGSQTIIKYCMSDQQIEEMLKIQWWQYNVKRLPNISKINLEDVDSFISYFKDLDPKKYIDGSQSSNNKQIFVRPVKSSITIEQMMHNKVPFKPITNCSQVWV